MQCLRGVWRGGRTAAFVFPDEIDPKPLIADIVRRGQMPERNQYQLFPTSAAVIEIALELIGDEFDYLKRPMRILEPSGGLGAMALAVQERFPGCDLVIIELDPINCALMVSRGLEPVCQDFLAYQTEQKFDLILTNPPFDGVACAKHFNHMFELLVQDGMLVCVLPSEIERRTDVACVATMLDTINNCGEKEELPAGSFKPLTPIDTFLARVFNITRKTSRRVDTLLIQVDASHATYLELNDLYKKTGHVATNLFSEIIDLKFQDEIHQLVTRTMTKEKCFVKLSAPEWQEVYDHYHTRMQEVKAWQQNNLR